MQQLIRKLAITISLFLMSISSYAQFFNSVNGELCYELYRVNDPIGEYRVFIVIDETIEQEELDKLINEKDIHKKSRIVEKWSLVGKRIEAERGPDYLSYPPIFPEDKKYVKPMPVKGNTTPSWEPWEGGRKYWQYDDKPFTP